MKTIRRKTKAHNALLDNAVGCTLYSEHNKYQGQECGVDAARTALDKFKSAKLIISEAAGTVVVRVTSRCWFMLEYHDEEPPAKVGTHQL